MANREELLIIRAARAGKAPAQLALGKRYLFGGGGLPQSHSTALHWLQKVAENNQPDAWLLIGANVPFDVAHQVKDPLRVAFWYERAFDDYAARVFDTVDGSPIGAEGNYRQRIYRFRSLMSARREHNRNRA
jgi:hypothetical protein